MKTLIALVMAGAVLAGCAVVPAEPGPVVYAAPVAVAPPPVVVVRPYGYYRYGYYHRAPYWHGGWR
jgi:hypothetical protein